MEKKKTAGVKECMMGLAVTMVADAKMTQKELENSISFTEEEPYVQFEVAEKWFTARDKLKEWIMAYVQTLPRCEEFT